MTQKNEQIFRVICAGIFLESLMCGVIIPLLPKLAKDFGISAAEIGFAYSAYPMALLVGSIPIGIVSDRFGRARTFIFGFALLGVTTFAMSLASSNWGLILSRAGQGLAPAAIWAAGLSQVSALFESYGRALKLGIAMSCMGLGYMAGPAIGGVLAQHLGTLMTYQILGLLIGALTILLCGRLNWPYGERNYTPAKNPLLNLKYNMVCAWLSTVAAFVGIGIIELTFPFILQEKFGLSLQGSGFMIGIFALTFVITQPLFGKLVDKGIKLKLIFAGYFCVCVSILTLSMVTSLTATTIATLAVAIGLSMLISPCLPMISEFSDEQGDNSYGFTFGLFNVGYAIGVTLGPIIGSHYYASNAISVGLQMYVLALLLLVTLLIMPLGLSRFFGATKIKSVFRV